MTSEQTSGSKWSCKNPECGIVIPYNPSYDMSNTLCSDCAAHDNAKRLLSDYKWSGKRKR
jgi:hypothetical protein